MVKTGEDLFIEAYTALIRFNDWANVNETMWTGWGDMTIPPGATYWRVKSEQALKSLEECIDIVRNRTIVDAVKAKIQEDYENQDV